MLAPLTRDGAAEQARQELSKRIYRDAQPNLLQRTLHAVWQWLVNAYQKLVEATPGHGLGLLLLIALAALLVALIVFRVRPPSRRRAATELSLPTPVSAAELRAEADREAAAGRWAQAVRARLRAVVRELEIRGVLDPQPGRTALEIALEVGRAQPDLYATFADAARVFGEIWYGRRPATEADYRVVLAADDAAKRGVVRVGPAGPPPLAAALPR